MPAKSVQERLEEAKALKVSGNEKVAAGEYQGALKKYLRVFLYTRGLPGSKRGLDGIASMVPNTQSAVGVENITPLEEAEAIELEIIVNNNISFCYWKLQNASKAVTHADNAIQLFQSVHNDSASSSSSSSTSSSSSLEPSVDANQIPSSLYLKAMIRKAEAYLQMTTESDKVLRVLDDLTQWMTQQRVQDEKILQAMHNIRKTAKQQQRKQLEEQEQSLRGFLLK